MRRAMVRMNDMSCSTTMSGCERLMSRMSAAVRTALFLGHAGGRLVEQNQIGIAAQHERSSTHCRWPCASWPTGLIGEAAKAQVARSGRRRRHRRLSAGVARGRDPEIFARGESIEHARHLGLDADAEPGDLMGVQPGDVLAAETAPRRWSV